MTDARAEFLAGDRPDDVVLYLADRTLDDPEPLLEYGERVEEGVLLVMEGETGRRVFQSATEMDAMAFAGKAMRTEGRIDRDLTGGTCPKADGDVDADDAAAADAEAAGSDASAVAAEPDDADADRTEADATDADSDATEPDDGAGTADSDAPADHDVRFVFAFAEEQNPEVGGQYEEGDVIHAYAHCACGAAYSSRWTVGDRRDEDA